MVSQGLSKDKGKSTPQYSCSKHGSRRDELGIPQLDKRTFICMHLLSSPKLPEAGIDGPSEREKSENAPSKYALGSLACCRALRATPTEGFVRNHISIVKSIMAQTTSGLSRPFKLQASSSLGESDEGRGAICQLTRVPRRGGVRPAGGACF